jgi:hypothetical protein
VFWRVSPSAASFLIEFDPNGTLAAAGRVGLITFKGCKPGLARRSGSRRSAPAISHGCAGETLLADCNILLLVGTPPLSPEDLARLARAYHHADPHLIDETSVRGEDGV